MIRVYPLEFVNQGGLIMPTDAKLHALAVQFCTSELNQFPTGAGEQVQLLASYARVYVSCEVEHDEPVSVTGIMGLVTAIDIPLMRFVNGKTATRLIRRANDYLQDKGVARGTEVFVYIKDGDDPNRCPNFEGVLRDVGARPAERRIVKVR